MLDEHLGYFTVADVVRIYRLTAPAIYVLASRHHWRKYRTGRTVHYHREDVHSTIKGTG